MQSRSFKYHVQFETVGVLNREAWQESQFQKTIPKNSFLGLIFCLYGIVIIFVFLDFVPGMAPCTILNSCFLILKFLRYKSVSFSRP